MSITDILEQAKADMCNHYCKYPLQEAPKNEDGTPNNEWLFEEGTPCENCPLNNL